jgi:hypothetical protein
MRSASERVGASGLKVLLPLGEPWVLRENASSPGRAGRGIKSAGGFALPAVVRRAGADVSHRFCKKRVGFDELVKYGLIWEEIWTQKVQ